MNNGSGDGGGCFGIEVWADTAKLTDMVIARFGDRCYSYIIDLLKIT